MELQLSNLPQLAYQFTSIAELHAAYMPFIKGGALFINSKLNYVLGDNVALSISLPDNNETIRLLTRIVWITPANSKDGKPAGVGLQFIDQQGVYLQKVIEELFSGNEKVKKNPHFSKGVVA